MPYLCAHLAFGDRAARALGQPFHITDDAYALGCLGPDVYFFDRLPPTPFVPHRKKHGNALHALDCAVLFDALSACAADGDKPYLCGFLTHMALDSTLHPYVEAHHHGIDHTRFEGVIDSIVYAETRDAVPYEALLKKRIDADAIDALLARVSHRLSLVDVRGAYARSLRKFHRLAPFLFDPEGKRYRALHRAERLIGKDGLLSAFLLAAPREDAEDTMNLSRAAWINPFRENDVRTDSVPMLFSEAETLAAELLRAYLCGDCDAVKSLLEGRTMQKGVLT